MSFGSWGNILQPTPWWRYPQIEATFSTLTNPQKKTPPPLPPKKKDQKTKTLSLSKEKKKEKKKLNLK